MNTDDLINMLASGDTRPPPRRLAHLVAPVALGVLASFALMALFLGVRPNLLRELAMPAFWTKFVFTLALARIGWLATARLSSPGRRAGLVPVLLALPLVAIWSIAAVSLLTAAPGTRDALFWGQTWRVCPFLIAGLSIPVFIGILRAMRELAPTRLRLAGAAAGLTAGATAAAVYCLHCPEMGAPFVGFWYVLGMVAPAAVGALIGPRALRW